MPYGRRTRALHSDTRICSAIRALEKASAPLDPPQSERKRLFDLAGQCSESLLNHLPQRGAYQARKSPHNPANFEVSEDGQDMQQALNVLDTIVFGPGLSSASGGDLSYVPSGGLFPSALGDFIASKTYLLQ